MTTTLEQPIETFDGVFVCGAMRSGTTMFRLMLDTHGQIANPGEVDFLFDHLRPDPAHPTGWRYDLEALRLDRIFNSKSLTLPEGKEGLDLLADFLAQFQARTPDKRLSFNLHHNLARAVRVLPAAKMIHMLRDPRDVARSSVPMGWAARPYYGIDHWIATEQSWRQAAQIADPDRIHELRYETLFADMETELKAVCAFIGVPYTADMLRYHENSSYAPPDPKLVAQWRHKCTDYDIALVEGKAGDLMAACGYAPTGAGHVPRGFEALKLKIEQKLYLWRFGMKRYGSTLFWSEKLSRALKLRGANTRIKLRMNDIHQAQLK